MIVTRPERESSYALPATHVGRRSIASYKLWRRSIASLTALMGLANIVSSLAVRVAERERLVRMILPLEIVHGTRHAAVVAGLALLAVSRGLWRGKRWPWSLTIGLLTLSAALHLLKGLDWEEAGAALTIAGLLIWQRAAFQARADTPSLRRALLAVGGGLAGLLIYTLAGGWLLQAQLAPAARPATLLAELGARLLLNVGPLQARSHQALWFLESLSVTGVAMLSYVLGALLRPILAAPAAPAERERAQRLLQRYGGSSLAPFALTADKSLYFGRSVEGLIAFRVAGDVAVVCGDPAVAPDALDALLSEFLGYCERQGWDVCFYETQRDQLAVYAAHGLHTLKIGEDAWIDLRSFSLKGKPIADIRHAVAKAERDQIGFALLQAPLSEADMALWRQMHAIVAGQDRGDFELQFSIGRLPAQPQPEERYAVALNADRSAVLAFCRWLPVYAVDGWALDVMLRAEQAPSGAMDFLIAQSLLAFQQAGALWASLGVAPLADAAVEAQGERSLLQRGVRFLYEHPRVNELYRYKSLFFFKRKFVPTWRSVYLVYDSRLALPRILYAILKVHMPAIGPALISDFLVTQSERNLAQWRAWLRPRSATRR
jgi:phosphatidylglycerol lysyltransferase